MLKPQIKRCQEHATASSHTGIINKGIILKITANKLTGSISFLLRRNPSMNFQNYTEPDEWQVYLTTNYILLLICLWLDKTVEQYIWMTQCHTERVTMG